MDVFDRMEPYRLEEQRAAENDRRAVRYIADFVYLDAATGKIVVEDVKGVKTEVYKLKRKLMLFFHGIRIKEV